MLPAFSLQRPTTVADAVDLLDEEHIPYWGGTELLLAMSMGMLSPAGLVDLKRLPQLNDIREDESRLVIGAGASHAQVAGSTLVTARAPVLAQAERRVGNARVRAQGSIGGNLCFAEPRSDIATALIALDASVTLRSRTGVRTLPVAELVLGPYWTAREPDELLVDVSIGLPAPTGAYCKLQVTERPTVGVAAVRLPGGASCRIVVGAAAGLPVVVDVAKWEDVDPEAVAAGLDPIADLTGSAEYKKHAAAVYIRRAIAQAQVTGSD